MNEVTTYEGGGSLMTASDLRNQVNAVQAAMQSVMKEGTHYGVIPGMKGRKDEAPKKSLFKAGSEVLLTMFHIAVDPQVEDLSDGNHIRYRVRCVGNHQATGIVVGTGIGEASTAEEKYAWRRAICDAEYENTDSVRRRIKYSEWNGKVSEQKQVRTNPSDLANTVLKMAKKRAQIDLTLTATAASDIFTQDIEDLPPELRDAVDDDAPRVQQPKAKGAPAKEDDAASPPASAGQIKAVRTKLSQDGCPVDEAQLCEAFKVETLDGITVAIGNAMLAWLRAGEFDAAPTVTGTYRKPVVIEGEVVAA